MTREVDGEHNRKEGEKDRTVKQDAEIMEFISAAQLSHEHGGAEMLLEELRR